MRPLLVDRRIGFHTGNDQSSIVAAAAVHQRHKAPPPCRPSYYPEALPSPSVTKEAKNASQKITRMRTIKSANRPTEGICTNNKYADDLPSGVVQEGGISTL